MHYEGNIIRPPSEADSILIQVTTGCSHNKCTFCGVYKDKPFGIKDECIIRQDIRYASIFYRHKHRVFLCDGDSLILPQAKLISLFKDINENLPWISRIGTYANAKSIARKSVSELKELKERGLRIIHMGLESGDDETLKRVKKWGDSTTIIEQGRKVTEAGIKLFVTVISGLGGRDGSLIHAEKTGIALTRMNPQYVGVLSLMPIENTELCAQINKGEFDLLSPEETLKELRVMLQHTELNPGYFYANHASNYLPLRARLPRDKQKTLNLIDSAIKGEVNLTPEWLRGL
ncbi:MAG: radical SAM protein [Fibrobacter sp.]|nr:radical SAM protein [Fibrobacter sp.]